MHELQARKGAKTRISFGNFTVSDSYSFGRTYLKHVPGETLIDTDTFDDPNLPGEVNVTVTPVPATRKRQQ